jgi:arginyl-tRNA synthetase
MNLFLDYQIKFIKCLKNLNAKNIILLPENLNSIKAEPPPKNQKSDLSFNAAMILAKLNKKSPDKIGIILKENFLNTFHEFEQVEIVKPGFLNITFKKVFWCDYILKIIYKNETYGSGSLIKKKYNIEFVSANPTGPLHVGHCRGAILGDSISNLLKFNGHDVTKEYYVNDYGNQIKNFVLSVYYRILEITEKKPFPHDKDFYPGDYIIDIANKIIKKNNIKSFKNYEKIYKSLSIMALDASIELIKSNLENLGVKHDNFIFESKLINDQLVNNTIKKLQKDKFIYKGKLLPPKGELSKDWKTRDQLLFASTKFGDDSDRALQKEDGTWTYFASDIAYHSNKIDRKFDILINILGADHSGYIKRIKAAVSAISQKQTNLVCKVSQLVKLFKNGKPFKMSKRKGDYVTAEDLVNEVGKDSVRFMMLNRSNDVELDFDFEKVSEKSKDNPVFYVQYANARINSIFNTLNLNIDDKINILSNDIFFNAHEIDILKKIAEWPRCIEVSQLKLEPHRIPFYLYDLATLFHSYWNFGQKNKECRFISEDKKINESRLLLLQSLSLVIKNGMSILGVSSPKSM